MKPKGLANEALASIPRDGVAHFAGRDHAETRRRLGLRGGGASREEDEQVPCPDARRAVLDAQEIRALADAP